MTWAVPGLVPEGCILFAGRPKLGKSWFVLQLGLAVASGDNLFGDIPVEQADVLYLALEDTRRRLQSRAKRLLGEKAVPPGFKVSLDCARFDEGGDKQLEEWLEQNPRTKMVIIDTFQKIKSRRSNNGDFETFSRLVQIARKFKICLLVVHHTRKTDAEDAFDTVSGSTDTASLADAMLVLKRARCSQNAELHITGRDIEESKKALRFDAQTMKWEILGDAEQVWKSKERTDIIDLLYKNGTSMRPIEIADALDKSGTAVRKTLSRMVNDGQVEWLDGGRYDLGINVRRAIENPAREEKRKENVRAYVQTFSEIYEVDESCVAAKWEGLSEEVFDSSSTVGKVNYCN
jgi:RecA-family ATPase